VSDARSYRAVLERVDEIAPATRAFFLRLPAGRGLPFAPGQFISLSLPVGDRPVVRAYSVASFPDEPELLEICLNLVPAGPGSTYLFALTPGSRIDFTGPWGSFVLGDPPPARCVFVADGPGIAPVRPMIRAALGRVEVQQLCLLHAAAEESLLLYRRDFEAWAERRFRFEPLVEGRPPEAHARLFSHVQRHYAAAEADRSQHFFICGVGEIVTRLRDLLRGAGYERRSVHYEKW
jgi:ferredoxin-NADP reductase